MSQQLISRNEDLWQLRNEGYDIEERSGYLLVKDVPYVNAQREIKRGMIVTELNLAGDVTKQPKDHTVWFAGDPPCFKNGMEIPIRASSGRTQIIRDVFVDHYLSRKRIDGPYENFYQKIRTYVAIISSQAQAIDPNVTAMTFPVVEAKEEESVFNYIDTASSRAGISVVTDKLAVPRVAIVGLGGTGAYVLDLLAKTPVREIHLFDGDKFSQHNAFRSPGAPSVEELRKHQHKVTFFHEQYSEMRRHIVPHDCYLDASNADQLREMSFVFLCLDRGAAKKVIVSKLEELGIPFIDVGMGIYRVEDSLGGTVRTTTSTPTNREHVRLKNRIPFSEGDENNEYSQNIQIADLNALNAVLAVIKWKKLLGFYQDLGNEHFTAYAVSDNVLINEDAP
jgi:tRNA A37 threonylcarbamoyladenosine dehydratase